jgi:hypothetical protein
VHPRPKDEGRRHRLDARARVRSAPHRAQTDRCPGKSPDFRLFKDKKLRACCELKSPRDDWVFDVPRDLKPGDIRIEVRRDPAAFRPAQQIAKAAEQLNAVISIASGWR